MLRALILTLLFCQAPQAPAGWSVVTADPDVSAAALTAVRDQTTAGLQAVQASFPGLPRHPFTIVVHADGDSLPAAVRAGHHPGSPGLALLGRHEIHLLLAETRASGAGLRSILVHELTHELLDQLSEPWGNRLPRWLHEGLAQVIAGDTYLGASEENIIWRATSGNLLPFSSLEGDFPRAPTQLQLAYAQSYSYVAWLEREFGRPALLAMVDAVDQDTSFQRAMVIATRMPLVDLEDAWRDYLIHGSGATWRALLSQCFSLLMILALPLLALALIRRLRVDRAARERLERIEAAAATAAARPETGGEPDPFDPTTDPGEPRDGDEPGAADLPSGADQDPGPGRPPADR